MTVRITPRFVFEFESFEMEASEASVRDARSGVEASSGSSSRPSRSSVQQRRELVLRLVELGVSLSPEMRCAGDIKVLQEMTATAESTFTVVNRGSRSVPLRRTDGTGTSVRVSGTLARPNHTGVSGAAPLTSARGMSINLKARGSSASVSSLRVREHSTSTSSYRGATTRPLSATLLGCGSAQAASPLTTPAQLQGHSVVMPADGAVGRVDDSDREERKACESTYTDLRGDEVRPRGSSATSMAGSLSGVNVHIRARQPLMAAEAFYGTVKGIGRSVSDPSFSGTPDLSLHTATFPATPVATADKIDTDAIFDGNVARVHDSQQSPLRSSLSECDQAPCAPAARNVLLVDEDGAGEHAGVAMGGVYVGDEDKNATIGGVGGAVASSPSVVATICAGAAVSAAIGQTVSQAAEESLPSDAVTTPLQSRDKQIISYASAASARASPPCAAHVGASPPLLCAGVAPPSSVRAIMSPVAIRTKQSVASVALPSTPLSVLASGSAPHRGVVVPPLRAAAPLAAVPVSKPPPPFATRWRLGALRSYRSLVGSHNLGSSCFLNAVLQAVGALPPMVTLFATGAYKQSMSQRSPYKGRVAQAFADLVRALCQGKDGNVVNAGQLKRELASVDRDLFGDHEHHDAHECARRLIDVLSDETNPAPLRPFVSIMHAADDSASVRASRYWEDYVSREESPLRKLFAGQTQTTTVCACGHTSYAYESVWDVSLSFPRDEETGKLPSQVSVETLLHNHVKTEKLSDSNGFVCQGCKQKAGVTRVTRTTRFSRLPEVAIFHFNRFEQLVRVMPGEEGGTAASGRRINTHVTIPRELSLRRFATEGALSSDDTDVYDLHSSVRHMGGTGRGHYTACVETRAGVDHVFNDANVLESKAARRDGVDTYIVVYHRRLAPPMPVQSKVAHPLSSVPPPIELSPHLSNLSNGPSADMRDDGCLGAPIAGASSSSSVVGLPAAPVQLLPLANRQSLPSESVPSSSERALSSEAAPTAFEPESGASAPSLATPSLATPSHADAPLSVASTSAAAAPTSCAAELLVGAESVAGVNGAQLPLSLDDSGGNDSLSADQLSGVDVAGPSVGVADAALVTIVRDAALDRLKREFGFAVDACSVLESKVAENCHEWADQVSGSATAPLSWHSHQFECAIEALTQMLICFDKLEKNYIPAAWHALRKQRIDMCTGLISSLEMLHRKFTELFASLRCSGKPDLRFDYALIGTGKPPAEYVPACLQKLDGLLSLSCPTRSRNAAADVGVAPLAVEQPELLLDERLGVLSPLERSPAGGALRAFFDGERAVEHVSDAGVVNHGGAGMAELTLVADSLSAPVGAVGASVGGDSSSDALNVSGEVVSVAGSAEPSAAERASVPSVSPVVPPTHECVVHDLFGFARQTAGGNRNALPSSLRRCEELCRSKKVSVAPKRLQSMHMIENRYLGSELRGDRVYLSSHGMSCDLSTLASKAMCLLRCVKARTSKCTHCECKSDAKGVRYRIAHADLRHLSDEERFVASMHEGAAIPSTLRYLKFLTREGDADAQNSMRMLVRVEVAAALVAPGTFPTLGVLSELEMELNTWYELDRHHDRIELALVSTPVDVVTMCSWVGLKPSSLSTGELLAAVGLCADQNNGQRLIGGDAASLYYGRRATERCLLISIAQGLVCRFGVTPDDLRSKGADELAQLFTQVQTALLIDMSAACLSAPFLAQELEFVISRLHGREEKIAGVVVEYSMRPLPGDSIYALFEQRGRAAPTQLATLPELVKLIALAMASSTLFPKCVAAELVAHWGCTSLDDATSQLRRLLESSNNMRLLRLITNRGVRAVWSEGVEKRDLDNVLSERVAQKMKQLPPASDLCDVLATFYAFSLRPLQSGVQMGRFCMRLAAWVLRMAELPAFAVLSKEAGTQQSGPRLSIERAGDGVGCAGALEHMLIVHYAEGHFEVVLAENAGRRGYFLTSEGEGRKHSALERLVRDNLERARAAVSQHKLCARVQERRDQSVNAQLPAGAYDSKHAPVRTRQRGPSSLVAPSSAQTKLNAAPLGPHASSPSAIQPPSSSQSSPTQPSASTVVVPEPFRVARPNTAVVHKHPSPGTSQARSSEPVHADAACSKRPACQVPLSSSSGVASEASPSSSNRRVRRPSSALSNAVAAHAEPSSRSQPSEAALFDAAEAAAASSSLPPTKRKHARRRRSRKQPSGSAPLSDVAKSVDSPSSGVGAAVAVGAAASSSVPDSLLGAAAVPSVAPVPPSSVGPKRVRRRRPRKQAALHAPPSAPARSPHAPQQQQQPRSTGARRRRGGRRPSASAAEHVCARDGCNFPKNGNLSPEWKQYVSNLGKDSSDIHLRVDGLKFLDGWVRYTFHFHDAAVIDRVRKQARAAWLAGEETGTILSRMDRKKGDHCLLGPERCRAGGGARCARCRQC